MNKYGYKCRPPKKKKIKRSDNKNLGLIMMLLGVVTVLALFLPVKYWVALLSIALVIFGTLLLKK